MNEILQGFYLVAATGLLLLFVFARAVIGRAMYNVNGYDAVSHLFVWFITAPIGATSLVFFWLGLA